MHDDDRWLYGFLGGFVLTVVLLTIGLSAANRHYLAVVGERHLGQRLAALGDLALVVTTDEGPLPLDPFAAAWRRALTVTIPLQPQNLAMPILEQATVGTVDLSALSNGRDIAWRLAWRDPAPAYSVDMARFSDAVALQFPLAEHASFMMGGPGARVHILLWKALWQRDLDAGFQDVQDLHPNYWSDLYWFAGENHPPRVPDDFGDPRSHAWFPARQAGNPLAVWERRQPVEELVAEGYGALTHKPGALASARGEWRDGVWAVVIRRPLRTADQNDYQIHRGLPGKVGIAVWDGTAAQVGGRKHYSDWIAFELAP
jgi:hypothetical protein